MSDPLEPICTLLVEATPDRSRQTEASIIKLQDGRLFIAWTDFTSKNWRDDGPAQMMAMHSADNGTTWSQPVVIQENIGGCNVMVASLIQLPSGRILFCFHRKNVESSDCHLLAKWSDDNGQTWSDHVQVTYGQHYYWCGTNDRLIQLKSGRILLPAGTNPPDSDPILTTFASDDDGQTWAPSEKPILIPKDNNYAEPVVVQRADGSVLMIIRNRSGFMRYATSLDDGNTWQPWPIPDSTCPSTPHSPSNCKRVPGSDDLLMVWNNTGGHRIPITAGISPDGGMSWKHLRDLELYREIPPHHTFAYPSICFDDQNVHITYWNSFRIDSFIGQNQEEDIESGEGSGKRLFHLKYRRLPLSWFYKTQTGQ